MLLHAVGPSTLVTGDIFLSLKETGEMYDLYAHRISEVIRYNHCMETKGRECMFQCCACFMFLPQKHAKVVTVTEITSDSVSSPGSISNMAISTVSTEILTDAP